MQSLSTSRSASPRVTESLDAEESVVECVVQAVAAIDNVAINELPPLTSVVDPDALSDLFAHGETDGYISFHYYGHRIVVTASGEVSVY